MRIVTSTGKKGILAVLAGLLITGGAGLSPAQAAGSTNLSASHNVTYTKQVKGVSQAEFAAKLKELTGAADIPYSSSKGSGILLTRAEAAKMIQLALSLKSKSTAFQDVSGSSPYATYIGAVIRAGIMNGQSERLFGPEAPITVSQASIIYDRVQNYLKPFVLEEASITDMQTAMEQGRLTSKQLVQLYLDRIQKYDDQGIKLNAVLNLNPNALQIAESLDQERETNGPRGPLHGIPVLVKDNYDTKDMPTTAGCICLKDSVPSKDAEQIEKLKQAGAIILGKTNLHEFAFGITTSSSLGGQTLNPYALDHYPGGSSGGTGAAIAANMAAAGMGTDTGGSIRIPSSFNSLVGIRPTVGLSSRDGIIPLALTQDVGGPMARSVADAAILLQATAGYDPNDTATVYAAGHIPKSYTQFLDVSGLKGARIGVATELFGTKPEEMPVTKVVNQAVEEIKGLGATAVPVQIPNLAAIMKYPSLSSYEFKFQLNDYLKELGPSAPYHSLTEIINSGKYDKTQETSMKSRDARTTLDEPEYKDIILNRTKITRESLLKVMADHNLDAIVYPTTTQPAASIGKDQNSGNNNRLSPYSGFPAISVPAGFTDDGLPVGIEFLGRAFDEGTLIKLAYSYEQGTHHRKSPVLAP
ncbi:amidase family protein [Paenibacillus sp. J22TS3]|uniref:amidase family protein n=1 Tax=Paenibacillus sp. J22TS3 TaxID=2807192 RepID=UPI001B12884A|nr:amidase family protein [Paenibacillus sp. J22TS3]GIP20285.1 hypothetical protein J22TS3_05600 [Paenibacillus sp. J22TS3]